MKLLIDYTARAQSTSILCSVGLRKGWVWTRNFIFEVTVHYINGASLTPRVSGGRVNAYSGSRHEMIRRLLYETEPTLLVGDAPSYNTLVKLRWQTALNRTSEADLLTWVTLILVAGGAGTYLPPTPMSVALMVLEMVGHSGSASTVRATVEGLGSLATAIEGRGDNELIGLADPSLEAPLLELDELHLDDLLLVHEYLIESTSLITDAADNKYDPQGIVDAYIEEVLPRNYLAIATHPDARERVPALSSWIRGDDSSLAWDDWLTTFVEQLGAADEYTQTVQLVVSDHQLRRLRRRYAYEDIASLVASAYRLLGDRHLKTLGIRRWALSRRAIPSSPKEVVRQYEKLVEDYSAADSPLSSAVFELRLELASARVANGDIDGAISDLETLRGDAASAGDDYRRYVTLADNALSALLSPPADRDADFPDISASARIDSETRMYSREAIAFGESSREPEEEPFVVNTKITAAGTDDDVHHEAGLPPNAEFEILVSIGPQEAESMLKSSDFPLKYLPSSRDIWVTVVAFCPSLFGDEPVKRELFLPQFGAAFTCPCAVDSSYHQCSEVQRSPYARIPFTTLRKDRRFSVKLAIYYHAAAVHVQDVDIRVGGRVASSAKEVYVLSRSVQSIGAFASRALSVLTSESASAVFLNGVTIPPLSYQMNTQQAENACKQARRALFDIHVEETGPSGDTPGWKTRYNSDNRKEQKDFEADLLALARIGRDMYSAFFPVDAQQIAPMLRHQAELGDPVVVQVARPIGERLVVPWQIMYDFPLQSADDAPFPCPSLKLFGPDSHEDVYPFGLCPFSEMHPRGRSLLCPFGFWGLSHIIEIVPHLSSGHDIAFSVGDYFTPVSTLIARNRRLSEAPSSRAEAKRHLGALRAAPIGVIDPEIGTRDDFGAALAQESMDMVYVYSEVPPGLLTGCGVELGFCGVAGVVVLTTPRRGGGRCRGVRRPAAAAGWGW